jgi:hypothetical protein
VYNSLRYLTDADAHAMAIYLKSLSQPTPQAPASTGGLDADGWVGPATLQALEQVKNVPQPRNGQQ